MAKEVFLMADVKDLGSEGDVVTVAEGYARNYLFPQKLAAEVTDATRRRLVKIQKERDVKQAATLVTARERATKLKSLNVTIPAKTSEEDKLYGSVTAADIEKILLGQNFDVDRAMIQLEEPIKTLGVYDVPVLLHPEVEGSVKVWVVDQDA
jgi:large subunit ribosomal protein L9